MEIHVPTNFALHEQLALKRLRRVKWKGWALRLWDIALAWLEPVELVRQVGPGLRPLRKHEWEGHEGARARERHLQKLL